MNGGNTKEEIQPKKLKHQMSHQREEIKLKLRKLKLDKVLWSKRKESSNKALDIQMLEPEEEKEVPPKEGYLSLHLH